MGATFYFDDPIYPVDENTGLADLTAVPTVFEVMNSNFHGNHQVYFRMTKGDVVITLHLTKIQAEELSDALHSAQSCIGYDNTKPYVESDEEE